MNRNNPEEMPALREALYALSMAKRVPDAQVLDEVVRQYPQFAEELVDFAVEIVVDSLRTTAAGEAESDADVDHLTPDVSRAISTFHNEVYTLRRAENASSFGGTNPFADLSRAEMRRVVRGMDANSAFVAKLRDGQILSETMSVGFKEHVVEVMDEVASVPKEVVYGHLAGETEAAGASPQFYKAASRPETGRQQTFAEAVESSGLTAEQQRRLLSL